MTNIEKYILMNDKVNIIIKNLIFDKGYLKKDFSTIKLFLIAYRIYKNKGDGFRQKNIEDGIKRYFNLISQDKKTTNVLKIKTIRMIDKLIESGFIYKTKSKEDKRISIFYITEEAKEVFKLFEKEME